MTNKKSIDGLSPKQRKNSISSVNTDGFTPLQQPRKTTRMKTSGSTSRKSAGSRTMRTTKPLSDPDIIRPEEFIPPRKTVKKSNLKTPKISNPPSRKSAHPKSTIAPKTSLTSKQHLEAVNEDFLEPIKAFDFDEETGELMSTKDEPKSEQPPKKLPKKSKKTKKSKKKWSKKRKIWTGIGIAFGILIIASIIIFIIWGNDILARLTGGRGNIMDLFSEKYEPLKEDANGRTNILAFGTSGFDMTGTDVNGSTHDGANLTDSIMIISFDQDTGAADLISLPRDLKVDANCNYTGKINEVYSCNNPNDNDEESGAKALADQISNVLGIDTPYYVHVNWGSLQEIVDDLGGITVTLDEPIADYDYTGAVYEAGIPYNLSGYDAVALSRARHGTEKGDFSRGASQQKILLGIKDKVLSDKLSVSDLLGLANTLGNNLSTNFTVAELKTLAHIATTIDWNNITEVSFLDPEPLLADGMIGGISYVYPTAGDGNFSEIRAYIKKLLTPPVDENASSDSAPSTISSENASIMIYNASGEPGIAAAEKSALESAGLSNISIDDLFGAYFPARYNLYSFTDSDPATTSALETQYHVTASKNAPSYLTTDYDFILVIGPGQ